jgi:hypothetical protein
MGGGYLILPMSFLKPKKKKMLIKISYTILPKLSQIRNFASKSGQRSQRVTSSQTIDFNILLRQLYMKTHPDILRSLNKDMADVNEESMQVLNNILTTIKSTEYPPKMIKSLPFYIKNEISESLPSNSKESMKLVHLNIRTAGGECRKSVTKSFHVFFQEIGLLTNKNSSIIFTKEYFPVEIVSNTGRHSST